MLRQLKVCTVVKKYCVLKTKEAAWYSIDISMYCALTCCDLLSYAIILNFFIEL